MRLFEDDFQRHAAGNLSVHYDESLWSLFRDLTVHNWTHFWINTNSDLLIFDANTLHGMPAHVFIDEDGSEMAIRYANPIYPDPGHSFRPPWGVEELSESRSPRRFRSDGDG